jgi:GNAT superfamily N-acetyltransferase
VDYEWQRGEYRISTSRAELDLAIIHDFLSHVYWAEGIPFDTVRRSIEHSLPFGVYRGTTQVGFARVITDYSTFAYIGDVFILPEYRSQGLGHWLAQTIVAHPELQGLRRWSLATRDAHAIYASAGFTPIKAPERWMERHFSDVYKRGEAGASKADGPDA